MINNGMEEAHLIDGRTIKQLEKNKKGEESFGKLFIQKQILIQLEAAEWRLCYLRHPIVQEGLEVQLADAWIIDLSRRLGCSYLWK